jgi:hypothetical protein
MGFILIMFFFLVTTPLVKAQISINEVSSHPEQSNEWIELHNISPQEIDLDGWTLEDQLSSPSIITQIESQALSPQSFLVIELLSAKLNNSADGVTLKNSLGEIIDQMSYEGSEKGMSWAKNSTGTFELAQPTRNKANIFPSPSPSPTLNPTPDTLPLNNSFHHLITISEFAACPNSGEREWIKLHNSDSQPHSISNWRIRDSSNQTRLVNTTIAAQDFQIISWSGSLLNNGGDEFSLENEVGESWQNIKYDACQFNTSYINIDQQWVEKTTVISSERETNKESIDTTTENNNELVSLTPPTPPIPPSLPYSPQQIGLNHSLPVVLHQTKLTNIIAKKLPRGALLSVILGGLWLLISCGWKIHEKISQQNSSS